MTARVLAMTVMVAVMGGHAYAQEPASDLSQLRVKPGDILTVTDTSGQRVQGTLTQLDNAGIMLELRDKQQRQFGGDVVATIEKRDSLKNGALKGLATGLILGGLISTFFVYPYNSEYGASEAFKDTLGMGVTAAAIGIGIDALVKRRQLIYSRSKTTVSVAPVISHDRKGVMFTLQR